MNHFNIYLALYKGGLLSKKKGKKNKGGLIVAEINYTMETHWGKMGMGSDLRTDSPKNF